MTIEHTRPDPRVAASTVESDAASPIGPAMIARRSRWRVATYAVFAIWVAGCVVAGAYLLATHLLTLPTPDLRELSFHRSVVATRAPFQRGQWLVVHVLDQDCKCSLRVLDHLHADPRPAGVAERVVLIAEAAEPDRVAAIRAGGFDLDVVTPDALAARYHVDVAPLLIIIDPEDVVRYVGGYSTRKQAADLRDVAVIEALRRGERVEPLPAFGCAVGRGLKDKIDPLGIRDWK